MIYIKLENINRKDIHGVYIYIDKTKNISDLKTLDDEFIYYVGLSDASISNRIQCHQSEMHFKDYLDKSKIYVCPLINSAESAGIEKLLINAYKPILNSKDKLNGISITKDMLPELEWYSYGEYDTYMSTHKHNYESVKNTQKTKNDKDFVISYGYYKCQNLIGDHDTINDCLVGFAKLYLYRKLLIEKNMYYNPFFGMSEYYKRHISTFITALDKYFMGCPNVCHNLYNQFVTDGYRFDRKYCTIILPRVEKYECSRRENTVDVCLSILLDFYHFFSNHRHALFEKFSCIMD